MKNGSIFAFILSIVFIFSCGTENKKDTGRVIDDALIDKKRNEILAYITDLSSSTFKGTISGQNCYHGTQILDSDPLQGYKRMVEKLHEETGKWVGIIGVDYEYEKLFSPDELSMTNKALIDYSNNGGLVVITFTPRNPWINDESDITNNPGTWDGPGNTQDKSGVTSLNDLIDPEKPVNKAWMRKLGRIADALEELKNAGIIVLWRPMQEMNGSWFWWGMESHPNDPSTYSNVYRHMHDYFTYNRKLNNLIWLFSPNASYGQDTTSVWNRPVGWAYPGNDFVDIVAGTAYNDLLNIDDYADYVALGKPLGMGEYGPEINGVAAGNGSLGTYQYINRIRTDYPKIAFWVSWHSYENEHWSIISNCNYNKLMNDPDVITRKDFAWTY